MLVVAQEELRKIVTKRVIKDVLPIKGADFIEVAIIGGWQVVVKKGQFKTGDEAYFFEIDAFLPESVEAFQFLQNRQKTVEYPQMPNTYVTGHVLRTQRLRGTLSQGLLLPIDTFPSLATQEDITNYFRSIGVFKYEKPLKQGVQDYYKGNFPTHLTLKTDSERVQNLTDEFLQSLDSSEWVATEKVDGMSTTIIKKDGVLTAYSRNYEYNIDKLRHTKSSHPLLAVIDRYGLEDTLPNNMVIKGELAGPKIQGNVLKLTEPELLLFDCEDLETGKGGWGRLSKELQKLKVPVYDFVLPQTVEEAVEQVNKLRSNINPKMNAEGVVWWHKEHKLFPEIGGRPNFKAINNQYLLKYEAD